MTTAPADRRTPATASPQRGLGGGPERTPSSAPGGPRTFHTRRGHLGRITVLSLGIGALSALLLTLIVVPGTSEPVITGVGLLGLSLGWALLAFLSTRLTDRPQRWAAAPAIVMGAAGAALLVLTPDDAALTAAGWVWAPTMLTLAVWTATHARRSLDTGARTWLVLPSLALLALVSIGGGYQTIRVTQDAAAYPMPGRSIDIGAHALHLDCAGAGSPTVVLQSGLGETSTAWHRIITEISRTTRVCAYDRAGQGWSDSAGAPQDARALAADLDTLLDRAGEAGPYVMVGHSSGGLYAMTFAAEHPADVAGMVLLDATNPFAGSELAARSGGRNGPLALLPSLARMGLAQLVPPSVWTSMPEPTAGAYRAFATTARAMTNTVDELSMYGAVFTQAQTLTTLGSRPLVVITPADKADTDPAGYAAQERFAALSDNSSLRTADTTHAGLVDDEHGATISAHAINDVVESVRTGNPRAIP